MPMNLPLDRSKLGRVLTPGTVSDKDVATELTRTYLQRVPGVSTRLSAPQPNEVLFNRHKLNENLYL